MKKYTVAIIGCGSIGALKKDHIDFPGSPNILTHANAICQHPRTELIALVDNDLGKADAACKKWNVIRAHSIPDNMYQEINPDIVICAVPTEYHYETLWGILKGQPNLVIAEKPFCSDANEANEIMNLAKEYCTDGRREIPIAIDYIRRFAKEYQYFRAQIKSEILGKALNARILYTRGWIHEGCHAVDLMRYFFGECCSAQLLFGEAFNDRSDTDLSVPVHLRFENCPNVVFQPCDGRKYGIFEIDICFENGRYRFIDNGLFVERYPILEENEWGHKSLNYRLTSVIRQETGLNTALYDLIDNAVNFLDGNADLLCTVGDAIKAHQILEGIR